MAYVIRERKEEFFESFQLGRLPLLQFAIASSSQGLIGPDLYLVISARTRTSLKKHSFQYFKPIMEQVKEETLEADGPRFSINEANGVELDTQKHSYFTSNRQKHRTLDLATSQSTVLQYLNSAPEFT